MSTKVVTVRMSMEGSFKRQIYIQKDSNEEQLLLLAYKL